MLKHAVLSCTICSNMSVAVGALVWTGRSVSSLRRGDEEDTRCCSSVPWDRERSNEIHGVNSPSHLLLPFPFTPVSFFFSPFPPSPLTLALFNRALALLLSLFLLSTFEELLVNVSMYKCMYVCVYVQQIYRDKSKRGVFRHRSENPIGTRSSKSNPVSTTEISAKSRRRAFQYHRLDLASPFKFLEHHIHMFATHVFTPPSLYMFISFFHTYKLMHTKNVCKNTMPSVSVFYVRIQAIFLTLFMPWKKQIQKKDWFDHKHGLNVTGLY